MSHRAAILSITEFLEIENIPQTTPHKPTRDMNKQFKEKKVVLKPNVNQILPSSTSSSASSCLFSSASKSIRSSVLFRRAQHRRYSCPEAKDKGISDEQKFTTLIQWYVYGTVQKSQTAQENIDNNEKVVYHPHSQKCTILNYFCFKFFWYLVNSLS